MSAQPLKITIMGSGGVGGYFGARLAAAGNDVTFVARGAHLDAIRTSGLRLDSEIGKLHLSPVKVTADPGEIASANAIIFAVKMRDTEGAAERLRPLVDKGAAVFTFQNGVESVDRIGGIVGAANVVPGVARIAANISAPGVIAQIGTFARLEYGELDGRVSDRVTAFHNACRAAGIDGNISPNIRRELWMKFAMLAPVAGMTALTRGPIGIVRETAATKALLEAAVNETVAVGVAMKTGLVPADSGKIMSLIGALPKQMMASMAHDLLGGKPIEVNGLSNAVVRLGAKVGVATPTHAFISAALAPFADGKPSI
ncbi:MAG TPA: 2-dehydropantoate 2-reductase [Hyphomicrobiaceae bacterium]|jgi:2-dehydropantoate 2-reductase|nr:2-dehydropantoate 2-reductase [Hyphomicrobiaceae bacterium]